MNAEMKAVQEARRLFIAPPRQACALCDMSNRRRELHRLNPSPSGAGRNCILFEAEQQPVRDLCSGGLQPRTKNRMIVMRERVTMLNEQAYMSLNWLVK